MRIPSIKGGAPILAVAVFLLPVGLGAQTPRRASPHCQRCLEPQLPSQVAICAPNIGTTNLAPAGEVCGGEGIKSDAKCPAKAVALEIGKLKLNLTDPPLWLMVVVALLFVGVVIWTILQPNFKLTGVFVAVSLLAGLLLGFLGAQDTANKEIEELKNISTAQLELEIEAAQLRLENQALRRKGSEISEARRSQSTDDTRWLLFSGLGGLIVGLLLSQPLLLQVLGSLERERNKPAITSIQEKKPPQEPVSS
jgi:hypothetical protein